MAKRLGSSNRRRGRKSERDPKKDRPGDIPRSDIDAAVATTFEVVSPSTEKAITPPAEVAADAPAGIDRPGSELSQLSTKDSQLCSEPLPARMLNEFVYCPRLFYYEFVEGVFVHNADTMRGAAIHTRVDSGSGAMPPAEGGKSEARSPKSETEEPDVIHSCSVSLGSERLGVTAKIDLVETRAVPQTDEAASELDLFSTAKLEVCPVDYKAGAPREGEEGKELWDADKMQLGLQCLLLRDNGYACNEGIMYYRDQAACAAGDHVGT